MGGLYESIRYEIENRVARVRFARPPLNVFDIAMMREIERALTDVMGRREVVAVVFEAAKGSRAFSAGVSVEEHSGDDYQCSSLHRSAARWSNCEPAVAS